MRTRNMIAAGCVPVIGGATKSLQNPTVLRRSPAAAFVPQRHKLALQALQFRDALFHVTDMGIQKCVDLTTVFARWPRTLRALGAVVYLATTEHHLAFPPRTSSDGS